MPSRTDRGPYLTGWAHSQFGRLDEHTLESLITSVAREALDCAGLIPADVDEIVLGHYNAGMTALTFPSSLALELDDTLRFTPATRVENACATGSAALHTALRSVRSGDARVVLVIGAEKMTGIPPSTVGRALLGADYHLAGTLSEVGFTGLFAQVAEAYIDRYGDIRDEMAHVASKNHSNGVANPYAQIRRELDIDFCREISKQNPIVAAPLRRTDCSPISDGAAALVVTTKDLAASAPQSVQIRGYGHANDFLPSPRRDPLAFAAAHRAWNYATDSANVTLSDLDLVELHDCFTIAEILLYEVIGLTEPGQGRRAINDGWVFKDGQLPINPSGGLKSKGHPIGATGVSQHVLAAMQLTDTAGGMQIPGSRLAGVFNMGGLAVANYATILERAT
ncbi:MAG: thiolase domain-containing protein [Rhodococcus sp. (in: high G+C Gram-positive bacteria)]|nr:MAG: thiolase domain-containing protein [Rhodococcus sp. (in: high G+C Gram-positive bacteria)]